MALHAHHWSEVRSLAGEGKTPAEIAVELNLPRPLVDKMLAHRDPAVPRPRTAPVIPWQISPQHEQDEDARMLRLEHRRRLGEGLTDREKDDLTAWFIRLQDMGGVVTYSPESGFTWVERTDEDRDCVRQPAVA